MLRLLKVQRLVIILLITLFFTGCGYLYEQTRTPPQKNGYKGVTTTRGRTHIYREEKQDKPFLVYIHGKLGSADELILSPLAQELRAELSLFSYDRPGTGYSLSRKGWGGWSPQDFSDHLHELLKVSEIKKPILLAHSWGGAIALKYAIDHPDKIHGMVLLAPAANPWPGTFSTSPADWFYSTYILSDLFFQSLFLPLGKILGPHAVKTVFAPKPVPQYFLDKILPLAYQPRAFQRAARDTLGLREALRKQSLHYSEIQVPTIILTSSRDTTVPPKIHAAPLSKALPHAALRYVDGVGHNFLPYATDEIAEAVRMIAAVP